MSDNKTPIQICIDRYFEIKNDKRLTDSQRLKIMLGQLIEATTIEEEAIKEAYEKGWSNGDKYDCMDGNDYFNQKFKPE